MNLIDQTNTTKIYCYKRVKVFCYKSYFNPPHSGIMGFEIFQVIYTQEYFTNQFKFCKSTTTTLDRNQPALLSSPELSCQILSVIGTPSGAEVLSKNEDTSPRWKFCKTTGTVIRVQMIGGY